MSGNCSCFLRSARSSQSFVPSRILGFPPFVPFLTVPAGTKSMCFAPACTRTFFLCLSSVSATSRSTWSCLQRYLPLASASLPEDKMWSRVALPPHRVHSAVSISPHLWRFAGVGKTS
ncbi:hypothetical protein DPMN_121953 [Dreissena polymorpha]|uniref:Uncharacterized protein n=1 Tax=Dreissena polymorpha TaxID=45954 RepID=A0A9D4GN37_DREPO|nr:hypothetical protein DPMN_121953 [Dreissena polymorpha]